MPSNSSLFSTYARADLAFERGQGVRLISADGEEYLDFMAGIGVNALGHGDPHLTNVLTEQAEKLWHVSNVYCIPQSETLAQRLVEATFADSVFFTNSGAEAIECALKTARHHYFSAGQPNRIEVIAFTGAFHGRTLATIAAAGNPAYTEGFGPALSGFHHIAPGDLEAVKAQINENTAAIIIEPVQGEGGVTAIEESFLRGLRDLCDRHDLLLILDEVQCGYGRTGKFFAHEWAGIEPDIMAIAKGIGAGFPLGACLATSKVANSMVPGTHGSTYGGNPLACAVGNAVLDRVLAPGFIEHAGEMGVSLKWHLGQLMQKYPKLILEVRGKGLMAGMKIAPPAREFVARLLKHKLLAVAAGDNVLRLLPPLIIEEQHIKEAMEKLDATLAEFEAEENENE